MGIHQPQPEYRKTIHSLHSTSATAPVARLPAGKAISISHHPAQRQPHRLQQRPPRQQPLRLHLQLLTHLHQQLLTRPHQRQQLHPRLLQRQHSRLRQHQQLLTRLRQQLQLQLRQRLLPLQQPQPHSRQHQHQHQRLLLHPGLYPRQEFIPRHDFAPQRRPCRDGEDLIGTGDCRAPRRSGSPLIRRIIDLRCARLSTWRLRRRKLHRVTSPKIRGLMLLADLCSAAFRISLPFRVRPFAV